VPLDALAIDPATYPAFFDKGAQAQLQALGHGEALLGESAAAQRRIGPGGVVELANGYPLTVGGVVDDQVVGAAELVVRSDTAGKADILTERFLLVAYRGSRAAMDHAIAGLVPDRTVRFRTREETPYLRHGDAVLPQVFIKERFGEFAYQERPDGSIVVDPAWRAENVTRAVVPILGEVECHRAVIPLLQGALTELEQENRAYLVDPGGYRGCFVPSLIRGANGRATSPARHSWGVALDLNFSQSPTGLASTVDPQLVEVMETYGFRSGEEWLVPDPGHFEYYAPPER
ncbi:MAG: M15 family metallopeptidase, partial [Acidimicrobiia bacterium]